VPIATEDLDMKLDDPTHGLKQTKLEVLALRGQKLDDFREFWDRSVASTNWRRRWLGFVPTPSYRLPSG
jgi:hypothetical protein